MEFIDWLVILTYCLAMVAIGLWVARRNRTAENFFVGDRNMHPVWAGISLVATLLSSTSYLAYPGQTISGGTAWLYQLLCFPLVYFLLSYLFIPYIMAAPVNSAYELLESRLGMSARLIAAGFFIALRISWLGLILYTCSEAMHTITGVDRAWLILGLALITILYTTEGGILAVIWTDVVQFVVLVAGAVFVYFYFVGAEGLNPQGFAERLSQNALQTPWISLYDMSIFGIAGWAGLWWVATCASDQVAMQRFFTTRDAAAARRAMLINIVGTTVSLLTLAAVGIALGDYYREHLTELPPELRDFNKAGDLLFPWVIANVLPAGMTGLVLAAILSAAMSSLSSGVNSVTTVLAVDFIQRRPAALRCADNPSLTTGQVRLIAVIIGVLVTGLTFLVPLVGGNFFTVASRLLDPLTGPLFGLFVLAFFNRRASAASAGLGVICGVCGAYAIAYSQAILGLERELHFVFIMPVAVTTTVLVGWLASYVLPQRRIIAADSFEVTSLPESI